MDDPTEKTNQNNKRKSIHDDDASVGLNKKSRSASKQGVVRASKPKPLDPKEIIDLCHLSDDDDKDSVPSTSRGISTVLLKTETTAAATDKAATRSKFVASAMEPRIIAYGSQHFAVDGTKAGHDKDDSELLVQQMELKAPIKEESSTNGGTLMNTAPLGEDVQTKDHLREEEESTSPEKDHTGVESDSEGTEPSKESEKSHSCDEDMDDANLDPEDDKYLSDTSASMNDYEEEEEGDDDDDEGEEGDDDEGEEDDEDFIEDVDMDALAEETADLHVNNSSALDEVMDEVVEKAVSTLRLNVQQAQHGSPMWNCLVVVAVFLLFLGVRMVLYTTTRVSNCLSFPQHHKDHDWDYYLQW